MLDAGQSLSAMYQARLKHISSSSTSSSINGLQLNALECVYSCYLVTVSHFICNASRSTGMRKTTQALTTQQIIEDYAGASNSLHTTSHSLASPNSARSRSTSTVQSDVEVEVEVGDGTKYSSESGSRSASGKFDLLSGFTQQNSKTENTEFGLESVKDTESQNHGNSTETDLHGLFECFRSRTSTVYSTSFSSVFSTSLSISKSIDMTTLDEEGESERIESDDISVKNEKKHTPYVNISSVDENGNLHKTVISDLDFVNKVIDGKNGKEGDEGRVGDVDTYVRTDIHSSEIREVVSHKERERRGSGEARERRGSGEARERERRGSVDDDALITAIRSMPLDISKLKNNPLQTHTQTNTPYNSRNQGQSHGRRVRTSTLSPEDEAINLAAAKLGLKVTLLYFTLLY